MKKLKLVKTHCFCSNKKLDFYCSQPKKLQKTLALQYPLLQHIWLAIIKPKGFKLLRTPLVALLALRIFTKKFLCFALCLFLPCFAFAEALELNDKDFEIYISDDISLSLGIDANPIVEKLSKHYKQKMHIEKAKSCMFSGFDKEFSNDDIIIGTHPVNANKDIIETIIILNNIYKTSRNIAVGNSKQEVEKAYGKSYKQQGSSMVYTLPNAKQSLNFALNENDIVIELYISLNSAL